MTSRIIVLILLVGLGVAGGYWTIHKRSLETPQEQQALNPANIKVGALAPNSSLFNMEGERFEVKDYKGKVVLINFWATWCPPCLIEMPTLANVYSKLKDKGFEVLAISLDDQESMLKDFFNKNKYPFKFFWDPKGKVATQYLVYGLPYTIILDREGKIRYKIFGGFEWDRGEPFEKIKSLL